MLWPLDCFAALAMTVELTQQLLGIALVRDTGISELFKSQSDAPKSAAASTMGKNKLALATMSSHFSLASLAAIGHEGVSLEEIQTNKLFSAETVPAAERTSRPLP